MEWTKRWAGSYTFISCSHWGKQYFFESKKVLGRSLDKTAFVSKKGVASFFVEKEEMEKFGMHNAALASKDSSFTFFILEKIKEESDRLKEVMEKNIGKIPSFEEYMEFHQVFNDYLGYYVFLKKTFDYLPDENMKEYEHKFLETRKYSEDIYSRTEYFFRSLADEIGKKEGFNGELLTCMLEGEMLTYLKWGIVPLISELEKRHEGSVIHFSEGKAKVFTGDEARKLEQNLNGKKEESIKGECAFPGKVKGKARVILDPLAKTDFKKGEILVTGMTRPEFLPMIEKASAIITDAGGILCHAAITAREMKKPCITGTMNATSVIKDGDLIKVDAKEGTVRIING